MMRMLVVVAVRLVGWLVGWLVGSFLVWPMPVMVCSLEVRLHGRYRRTDFCEHRRFLPSAASIPCRMAKNPSKGQEEV